ncbi:hypothetical protein [Aeromonas salmonicida]|uniref:hypothetical protein n=1 Tax=Aeromonas salmonicida TaxID=645 RepID=UPI003D1CF5BB
MNNKLKVHHYDNFITTLNLNDKLYIECPIYDGNQLGIFDELGLYEVTVNGSTTPTQGKGINPVPEIKVKLIHLRNAEGDYTPEQYYKENNKLPSAITYSLSVDIYKSNPLLIEGIINHLKSF